VTPKSWRVRWTFVRELDLPGSSASNLACEPGRTDNRLVGAREERLGANEALFREVNERVAEVAGHFIAGDASESRVDFSCECGARTCTERIALSLPEYEGVRAEATRFVVRPGHDMPEIERVVERHSTYLVVEKRDPDAEEIARETDPRA
jgi:hypothetical protein